MRGGKREGSGRKSKLGIGKTTIIRVPEKFKSEILEFIELLSKSDDPKELIENVTKSKSKNKQLITILEDALKLKANAGGAIKKEIRKVLEKM